MTVEINGRMIGRPKFKFTQEILNTVEKLAGQGMSQTQICLHLGINQETLIRHKKENLAIVEALARGKAEGIRRMTAGLMINGITPTEREPGGNVNAQKFYLSCIANWAEKSELKSEVNSNVIVHIKLPDNGRRIIDAK